MTDADRRPRARPAGPRRGPLADAAGRRPCPARGSCRRSGSTEAEPAGAGHPAGPDRRGRRRGRWSSWPTAPASWSRCTGPAQLPRVDGRGRAAGHPAGPRRRAAAGVPVDPPAARPRLAADPAPPAAVPEHPRGQQRRPAGQPGAAARRWPAAWGSRWHSLGAVGHLNPASGFGEWPEAAAADRRAGQRVRAAPTRTGRRCAGCSSRRRDRRPAGDAVRGGAHAACRPRPPARGAGRSAVGRPARRRARARRGDARAPAGARGRRPHLGRRPRDGRRQHRAAAGRGAAGPGPGDQAAAADRHRAARLLGLLRRDRGARAGHHRPGRRHPGDHARGHDLAGPPGAARAGAQPAHRHRLRDLRRLGDRGHGGHRRAATRRTSRSGSRWSPCSARPRWCCSRCCSTRWA